MLGGMGTLMSRRMHTSVANMQDASIRFGVMFGLSTPILQFVLERLELAIDFSPAETVPLALFTFVIAALFHLLLDNNVKFLAERKRWISSMITLGVLQGITISFESNDEFALLLLPVFWIPSSFGLVLLLRLFDKPDYPITLRITLQAALFLLVAYLTWTAFMGVFGVIVSTNDGF